MGNTNARKIHKLAKKHRINRKVRSNNIKLSGKLRPSEMVIHGRSISKKKQQKIDRLIKFVCIKSVFLFKILIVENNINEIYCKYSNKIIE